MSLSAPIESDVHTTYLTNAEEEANKFEETQMQQWGPEVFDD